MKDKDDSALYKSTRASSIRNLNDEIFFQMALTALQSATSYFIRSLFPEKTLQKFKHTITRNANKHP